MWQERKFLDSRKCFIALAIIVVISSVQCQNQASVEPKHVEKNEGESAEILCSFGRAVQACRFYSPNNTRAIKLSEQSQSGRFQYYGSGFANGQCGIRITELQKIDEGAWKCQLDVGDDQEDVYGDFTVTITKAPQKLELFVSAANELREDVELHAECTFTDGIPPATISWFLGNDRVQVPDAYYNEAVNGDFLVSSVLKRILRAGDNLKALVCRIDHPALQDGFLNTTHQLHVNYPPQAVSRPELYISGLTIGSSADIELKIRSNPRPNLQWTIDGVALKEGTQNEKYVVNSATQTEDGRWSAKLTIIQLSLEDTTKVFNLRAGNAFGSQDYQIRIGGSPDESASGLGIVAIIGIVIAALVVLVIVALLVVARITKRWCFAGASMHPNSPDSEAQIAPDEDKTHEQYEQHDGKVSDEESGGVEPTKAANGANGKSNGNTSV